MRAAKKDRNHQQVVKLFKALGWSVLDVAQLKKCCDLFVSKNKITVAIEVKDGTLAPSRQRLTDGEQLFADNWKGEYRIVRRDEDVINLDREFKK